MILNARQWSEVKRRFADFDQYRNLHSWASMLYSRVLASRIGKFFPFQLAKRRLQLKGFPGSLLIRLGTSDGLVLEEIYFLREYEILLKQNLADVKCILDLGANIGLSLRLWQAKYPAARIIGVEPDPDNFAMVKANIAAGGEPDRFTVVQACAAGRPRDVFLDRSQSAWGFTMVDQKTASSIVVPALTVPQVLERAGATGDIDILKCDIEGGEREVFGDCAAWIGRVKVILAELHGSYTAEVFAEDLRRNGAKFDLDVVSKGHNFAVVLAKRPGATS